MQPKQHTRHVKWRTRPHQYIVDNTKHLRAYKHMPFPHGSLADLCACSGDWACSLEIDYFHAEIAIESLPEIFGKMCTTVGGSTIFPNRNFPVLSNYRQTTRKSVHLDLICTLPFRLQIYFCQREDLVNARRLIISFFDKHHCHYVKANLTGAHLCSGPVMIPTRVLVQSLKCVKNMFPSCELYLNQYGGKYSWLYFQMHFENVFIPNRNNLWDLTLTMRHKSGRIIMFRRKGKAGIYFIVDTVNKI